MATSDGAAERAWRAGAEAHPGLELARDVFARYLAARDEQASPTRAADLYLACACLEGVPGAAETFVATYLDRVPTYLSGKSVTADLAGEVRQQLAIRLLIGEEGKPPLLGAYAGRGTLEGFVRIAAGRLAIDLQRHAARQPRSLAAMVEPEITEEDAELKILKEAYREPFRQAFADAIAGLGAPHRALLRLHYVEGMTTAQLAELYRLGRATIVRRLGDARDALIGGLVERLRPRLGLEETGELEGFLRLVRSQLDLSLVRLLRETMS